MITLVVGTRPNFMKAIPLWKELPSARLVHTGQHYQSELTDVFFEQFKIAKENLDILPDYPRDAPSYEALGWMVTKLAEYFRKKKTKIVVVFGDVNSTLAGALAANFLKLSLIHVESGLRSYDPHMPEERNRVLVDHLADVLCTTEYSAEDNLKKESVRGKIVYTGNTMIDTLCEYLPSIQNQKICHTYHLKERHYLVVTLHREENIEPTDTFLYIWDTLCKIKEALDIQIVFPLHPRTKKAVERQTLSPDAFILLPPLGYLEMMSFVYDAGCVITDSGGIQEESSYLGVPCVTLRKSFERPSTLKRGSNVLISTEGVGMYQRLLEYILQHRGTRKNTEEYRKETGEGRARYRILEEIRNIEEKKSYNIDYVISQ